MKIIQVALIAIVMSFVSLHAMQKFAESPNVKKIKEFIEKYDSKDFSTIWDSLKENFTKADLESSLIYVLNKVSDLNDAWLEFTLVQRSLPGSIGSKSFSATEKEFEINMKSLAKMADSIKDSYKNKFKETIFLSLRKADARAGFLNWKRYFHCQDTAQAIQNQIAEGLSIFTLDETVEAELNVMFYACMLSNEQKRILLERYFPENTKITDFIRSMLTTSNFLPLRGYAAPLIKEPLVTKRERGYGYINIIDVALINGEMDFINEFLLNKDQNLIPSDINTALNNICIDEASNPRIALDLLIIWIMGNDDRRISSSSELIKEIYNRTDEKFFKEPIKIGTYTYVKILNWLEEQLKVQNLDKKKKTKIDELIRLLTTLNNHRFPKQKEETEVERKQRIAREKREQKKKESADSVTQKLTETSLLTPSVVSEEKGKQSDKADNESKDFGALVDLIRANDADGVEKILQEKIITDDDQAREFLSAAIDRSIKFNNELIENVKKIRVVQAEKKPDAKIKPVLEKSQAEWQKSQRIIKKLSEAIQNLRQILPNLKDDAWSNYMVLSDDVSEMSIIKNMLTDSVYYQNKDQQMLDALYATIFNSQALNNAAKVDLIDFYVSQKKDGGRYLIMLKDLILSNKGYLELAGINSPILSTGQTLLHEASKEGKHALVEFLLAQGASPNIKFPELPVIMVLEKVLKEPKAASSLALKRMVTLLTEKMDTDSKKMMQNWLEQEQKKLLPNKTEENNKKRELLSTVQKELTSAKTNEIEDRAGSVPKGAAALLIALEKAKKEKIEKEKGFARPTGETSGSWSDFLKNTWSDASARLRERIENLGVSKRPEQPSAKPAEPTESWGSWIQKGTSSAKENVKQLWDYFSNYIGVQ